MRISDWSSDVCSSDLAEVRRVARDFVEGYPKLDVLVNNAGALFTERRLSADGIEMTLALNHLNYFLLTNLLLDRLRAAPAGRIVNVASRAHAGAPIDFGDLRSEEHTSELQSLMSSSYAVFFLKQK